MRFSPILFIIGFILSCNTETEPEYSHRHIENQFLSESKFAPSPLETDETLKDYVPAQTHEIDLVRNAEDSYRIEYGYSSGECFGFCKSKIEFTSKGILNTKFRWSDNKEIIEYSSIEDSTYNELIASVNYEEFIDFDEYLGCGDCADAGAEWIEIKNGEQTRKLGGTYGFEIACISTLLHYLRDLDKIKN
ncbi:MAG: hypothetical protein GQ574_12325 [Crocinitomix sp.]|nr:hypothetical protein [Crocinitomix sp.]